MPASSESPAAKKNGWKSWRAMFEDGLRCQVQAIFQEHQLADAVEVAIDGARVTLRGSVPDALTSQLVEDLAWSVPAVRQCDNHLRVDD
jgi:osmotically-inducible protein OsmY